MKYALKPSSPILNISGSNKIIYFDDEKSLFKFFHIKMKQDLVNPVVKNERYSWKNRNSPNKICATDVTGIYSLLISSELDFQFLCSSRRVRKFVHNNIPNSKDEWQKNQVLWRMRSLLFNWTLYTLNEQDGGFVMKSVGWGNYFKLAKKENLLKDINLSYRLPETE